MSTTRFDEIKATARLPRKPSFRWIPGRSCTSIHTGPLNGGRSGPVRHANVALHDE